MNRTEAVLHVASECGIEFSTSLKACTGALLRTCIYLCSIIHLGTVKNTFRNGHDAHMVGIVCVASS